LPALLNPNPAALRSQLPLSPQNVLMIGVSLNAWLKLLTSFPEIKNIDVMEVNSNHLAALRSAHKRKGLLFDLRLHLSVEDGRRWLKNHPKQQYDLIVVNSTCYWRSCASRLLSREFLALMRLHTREGGAVMYNAAGSRYVVSLLGV
jgi:spermidine synthase